MVPALLLAAGLSLPQRPLANSIERITRAPALARANVGVAVYDLDAKRTIYQHNAQTFFLAASTTKLLTEGATLAFLGPSYRFTTNVYAGGTVDGDGTLHGDLILRASGDPNLSGRLRPDGTLAFENEDHSYDGDAATKAVPGDPLAVVNELAQQVAARGIHRITGHVIVDDSLYDADYAEPGTGAVVSPVMVNDNIVDVTVSPGTREKDQAALDISPETPYVRFIDRVTTCAASARRSVDLQDTRAAGDGRAVIVSGCVPLHAAPVLYAYDVRSPRRFAEAAFAQSLQRAGIDVSTATSDVSAPDGYANTSPVATHVSAPLSEDVKVTLKVSDNLHADAMPYLWAHGDLRAAFAMERAWLQRSGLDTSQVVQSDGLGGDAFITPQFMVKYLAFLRTQRYFAVLERALPVLGVDGTLFDIQTHSPAAAHVRAKTGTWSAGDSLNARQMVTAKGLAGYVTTRSGRHLAFCAYINNYALSSAHAAHDAGDILGAIATAIYERTP